MGICVFHERARDDSEQQEPRVHVDRQHVGPKPGSSECGQRRVEPLQL